MAKFQTIEFVRGAGTSGTITLKQNSVAVNITGYTGRLVAKAEKSDTDANAALNKALTIQNASSGIFAYSISDSDSASMSPRSYYGEISITPASGSEIKILGIINVCEEVYDN